MPSQRKANLFVYGTLRRGADNEFARLLDQQARFLGLARMSGRLYSLGEYPAAIPSNEPNEWVIGELFEIDGPAEILAALDNYEGSDFHRVTLEAQLDSGERVEAYVYLYRGLPSSERIRSGDWLHQQ